MAQLVVPVKFVGTKGSATVKTLIDTGAEMSLISGSVARTIGVPVFGNMTVRGAGRAQVEIGKVQGIQLPGISGCRTGPVVVWIFERGAVMPGTGLKAILGYDFMMKARMEIAAFTRTRQIRCVAKRKRS
jgi:predicted aspartyl protease